MTKTVDDLQVGDTVAVYSSRSNKYTFDTVIKITKTRVVCEKSSFMRTTLRRVGDGDEWHPTTLARDYNTRGYQNLLSVEAAKEHNEKWDKENARKILARKLSQISREKWEQLSVDDLQSILDKVEK